MEIITRYHMYMKNRSNSRLFKILYNSRDVNDVLKPVNEYYSEIKGLSKLFFVVEIGSSRVVYYWNGMNIDNDLNLYYNSYNDDCQRICDYDKLEEIKNKLNRIRLFNKIIESQGIQTAVFIDGSSQEMPEPFTYDELQLNSFPNTLIESFTKINVVNNELFRIESCSKEGIWTKLSIYKDESRLFVGGLDTIVPCNFYVIKGFD